jgi:hypothetical protein
LPERFRLLSVKLTTRCVTTSQATPVQLHTSGERGRRSLRP